MLTWMRTHQKTIMTWTLYLVIPSFVLLYGYGKIQRRGEERWAVKVNGREISYSELQRMESNLREQYRRQYGDRLDDSMTIDFRQRALDTAIRRQLVLIAAEQFGFGVSDNELAERIASFPAFQRDGKFDLSRYYYYLNQVARVPESYFEDTMRQEILRSKVTSFIYSTTIRPMPETEADFKRRNERVMAEMLAFRPRDYTENVTVDQEALLKFFQERREDYRIPEQRRIQYVEYAADSYRDQVRVTEERLTSFFEQHASDYTVEETRRAEYVLYAKSNYINDVSPTEQDLKSYFERNQNRYQTERRIKVRFVASPAEEWDKKAEVTPQDVESWYEQRKSQYTRPEEVHARHILLKLSNEAAAEEETRVRVKIEEVRKEILGGLDFGEAAQKYSEDAGTAPKGGDLGFFPRERMVPPFSEAAFSLPVGEISQPVKTAYGFHLIKVEEKKESLVEPLSDVREQIEKTLRREKGREAFQKFAEGVQSLEDIKDEYSIQSSDWFGRGDEVVGINRGDVNRVFFTAGRGREGSRPEPVYGSDAYYLVELAGDEKPRPKTFEETIEQVRTDARDEMAARQALLAAQADLGRLTAGQTTWDQVLRERNLIPTQTEPFSRSTRRVTGLVTASQGFVDAAFGLAKVGDVGGPVESDRGAYLLRLSAITEPSVPELSDVKDKVREDATMFEAGDLAFEDAAKLADEAFNSQKPLVECAKKLNREVLESELFKEGEPINPIGPRREINERAFAIKKAGTVSDVISIYARPTQEGQEPSGPIERCYVISLFEIKESYLPELAEVRQDVEKNYKLFLAADLAKQKAEQALAVLHEKVAAGTPVSATRTVDFESLVPGDEVKEAVIDGAYLRPTSITQASIYVPGVGQSTDLRRTAFALAPGQISGVIEARESIVSPEGKRDQGNVSGYYIIQVVGREKAGPVVLGQQESQMETYWEQNSQNMAFNAWIDSVSRSARIEVNAEVIFPSDLVEEATEESVADEG